MVKIIKKMFFTVLMIVPCILVLCGCTNEVPVENAKISEVNISVPTILGNTYITRPGLYDATTRDLTYTVKTKWYTVNSLNFQDLQYEESKERETFEVGKMYIACFTFEALDGELDDYLKVNVTYNGKVYQGDYDETLGYWYSFYCSEEYVEPIVTLTNHLINIDNSEVNKMPSYTATAENCIVTVEKWMYNRPGNVDLVEMGEEETFDYGVAYFAQLSITPYYGYELAGELTFSNGVQEGDEIVNDGTITVLVRFDEVIETITIYEIRMMLPEALGGNTISSNNASSLTNSGYYSITTNWHRITNPSVENLEYVDIEENEAFEVGSIYLVTFTFNPAQGVNLDKAAVYLTYKETDTLLQNDETLGYYYFIFCIEDVVIK